MVRSGAGHDHEHDEPFRPMARGRERSPSATAPGLAGAGNTALTRLMRGAVQRSELASQGAGPLDPGIAEAIESSRAGGSSLPEPVRNEMEGHFGVDLGSVRVHTDANADTLNRSVQAEAFTSGSDIFFSSGKYAPDSPAGKELLAHEMTHVVQQVGGGGAESTVSHPDDDAEVEARQVGRAVVDSSG